jgi:hypothetical protein
MSQITSTTLPSGIPPPQWNPVESLNIEAAPKGGLFCVGIKKSSGDPCRWILKRKALFEFINELARLCPRNAILLMQRLAELALCEHHSNQERDIVQRWTETINKSRHISVVSNIAELHGSLPSWQAMAVAKPTLSPPSSNSTATFQHLDDSRCHTASHLASWDRRLEELRNEVDLIKRHAVPINNYHERAPVKTGSRFNRWWMRIISRNKTLAQSKTMF